MTLKNAMHTDVQNAKQDCEIELTPKKQKDR
jgi:hypothetical protein